MKEKTFIWGNVLDDQKPRTISIVKIFILGQYCLNIYSRGGNIVSRNISQGVKKGQFQAGCKTFVVFAPVPNCRATLRSHIDTLRLLVHSLNLGPSEYL